MPRFNYTLILLAFTVNTAVFAADTAPDFSLLDIDGDKFKLSKRLETGPVLLDFWATWCKPCLKELPEIERIHRTYVDSGLQVITVSTDSPKSKSKVKPYVRGQKYTFEVLYDTDQEVRRMFGGKVIPLTLLIASDRRVVYRHLGYSTGDEVELEKAVRKELGMESMDGDKKEPSSPEDMEH